MSANFTPRGDDDEPSSDLLHQCDRAAFKLVEFGPTSSLAAGNLMLVSNAARVARCRRTSSNNECVRGWWSRPPRAAHNGTVRRAHTARSRRATGPAGRPEAAWWARLSYFGTSWLGKRAAHAVRRETPIAGVLRGHRREEAPPVMGVAPCANSRTPSRSKNNTVESRQSRHISRIFYAVLVASPCHVVVG